MGCLDPFWRNLSSLGVIDREKETRQNQTRFLTRVRPIDRAEVEVDLWLLPLSGCVSYE
jgi:hypothetical protein